MPAIEKCDKCGVTTEEVQSELLETCFWKIETGGQRTKKTERPYGHTIIYLCKSCWNEFLNKFLGSGNDGE